MMVSAGGQDTGDGSFNIKVPGLFENIEDVLNTPIKTFGDSVITLGLLFFFQIFQLKGLRSEFHQHLHRETIKVFHFPYF